PFETLEGRQLMSATMHLQAASGGAGLHASAPALVVTGTSSGDNIDVYGTVNTPVSKIVVNAMGGDDRVIVEANLMLPSTLSGGDGNDFLRGGGGADS